MSVRIIGYDSTKKLDTVTTGSSLSGSVCITQYDILGFPQGGGFSYDTAMVANTPPATPTDVCCIQGSDISAVYVTRMKLHTIQTTGGINAWFLIKRKTPNSGGTFFFVTASATQNNELGIKREDNYASQSFSNLTGSPSITSPAPNALVTRYTANPTTLGYALGTVRAAYIAAASTTTGSSTNLWDFDDIQTSPIVLRGSDESLCLNFAGAALPPGLSVTLNITWKELPLLKSLLT